MIPTHLHPTSKALLISILSLPMSRFCLNRFRLSSESSISSSSSASLPAMCSSLSIVFSSFRTLACTLAVSAFADRARAFAALCKRRLRSSSRLFSASARSLSSAPPPQIPPRRPRLGHRPTVAPAPPWRSGAGTLRVCIASPGPRPSCRPKRTSVRMWTSRRATHPGGRPVDDEHHRRPEIGRAHV